MKKDLSSNIRKIMSVYLVLILALITYIVYFTVVKVPEISTMSNNSRTLAKENEVLRGTIYDRDGNSLTTSERTGALTQSRGYNYGSLYAHIIGYNSQKYGKTGLESLYNSDLTDANNVSLKTLLSSIKSSKDLENIDTQKVGNSVVTTLDPVIQQAAFDALRSSAIQRAAVVALDPKTGEILASVSKPFYNPNYLDEAHEEAAEDAQRPAKEQLNIFLNRVVSGLYPPGSVFKVITLASALENIPGVTEKTFNDNGKIEFKDDTTLPNQNGTSYGNISLKRALAVSSNVVFGGLAMDLGNSKLKETAESFGFNNRVPRDGIVIDQSIFPSYNSSELGNIARSGIGQSGILATPMEMALVASTIANDGIMMEPHLVSKVIDKNGNTVRTIKLKEVNRVISIEDAATIKDYMKNVVNTSSSYKGYFSGTDTAGKTGTAENNEGDGTPHSWFIGFAPADDPQIAVAVVVENGGAGSGIAARVTAKVINAALGK